MYLYVYCYAYTPSENIPKVSISVSKNYYGYQIYFLSPLLHLAEAL